MDSEETDKSSDWKVESREGGENEEKQYEQE